MLFPLSTILVYDIKLTSAERESEHSKFAKAPGERVLHCSRDVGVPHTARAADLKNRGRGTQTVTTLQRPVGSALCGQRPVTC